MALTLVPPAPMVNSVALIPHSTISTVSSLVEARCTFYEGATFLAGKHCNEITPCWQSKGSQFTLGASANIQSCMSGYSELVELLGHLTISKPPAAGGFEMKKVANPLPAPAMSRNIQRVHY